MKTDIDLPLSVQNEIEFYTECIEIGRFQTATSKYPVQEDKTYGLDPYTAFYLTIKSGQKIPTRDSYKLRQLLDTARAVKDNIDLWAHDLGQGNVDVKEFNDWCKVNKMPKWFSGKVYYIKNEYFRV